MKAYNRLLALASLTFSTLAALAAQVTTGPISVGELTRLQQQRMRDGRITFTATAGAKQCQMGYTDEPTTTNRELPDNMKTWLCCVEKAAEYVEQHPELTLGTATGNATVVEPLLGNIKWDQGAPYNKYCPNGMPTGCVATAMAQVLYYWRYPEKGIGQHGYMWNGSLLNVNFGQTTYPWDQMVDEYIPGQCSTKQQEAVALLSYHCGVAIDMQYGYEGSASFNQLIPAAAKNYFGYNSKACLAERACYTYEQWEELLDNELQAGRPVIFSADNSEVGHAFVIDGRNEEGLYHVNWGWSGYFNGYFDIGILKPEGAGTGGTNAELGYCMNQNAILQLCPEDGVGEDFSPLYVLRSWITKTAADGIRFGMEVINDSAEPFNGLIGMCLADEQGKRYGTPTMGEVSLSAYPGWGSARNLQITLLPDGVPDGTYHTEILYIKTDNPDQAEKEFPKGFKPVNQNSHDAVTLVQVANHEFKSTDYDYCSMLAVKSCNYSGQHEFAVGRPYEIVIGLENITDETFLGTFRLAFDYDQNFNSEFYVDSEDYIKIGPHQTYELKLPLLFTKDGSWEWPLLISEEYGTNYYAYNYIDDFYDISAKYTSESPGILTLAETPQLLTERCESDGEVAFSMVIDNLEGGNFSDMLAMLVYGTKTATGTCRLVMEQAAEFPMKSHGHEVTFRGKLTGLKSNSRYYALPSYKTLDGSYQFMYRTGTKETCPIEMKVYAPTAGIETVLSDESSDEPRYDLMGRRLSKGHGLNVKDRRLIVVR